MYMSGMGGSTSTKIRRAKETFISNVLEYQSSFRQRMADYNKDFPEYFKSYVEHQGFDLSVYETEQLFFDTVYDLSRKGYRIINLRPFYLKKERYSQSLTPVKRTVKEKQEK